MDATDSSTVTIDKIIMASIPEVWEAWTAPSRILDWFGSDPNGSGLAAKLDVRIGGSFEITFADADSTEHTCSGVYAEVEEFCKLAFSWAWKSEPGTESYVELSLAPEGGHTRMHFTHSHLDGKSKHDYLNGWNATFLKLDQLLTKRTA